MVRSDSENNLIDQYSEPLHDGVPSNNPHDAYDLALSMSAGACQQTCQDTFFDAAALAAYLRRKHPQSTAAHVSAQINVPIGTVQNWIDRKASPNVESFVRLVRAFGPECLRCATNVPIDWLDETILFQSAEGLKKVGLQNIIQAGEIAKKIL